MLAHEYSWHDAIYLAHSSEGCGAANVDGQKAKLDSWARLIKAGYFCFWVRNAACGSGTEKPAEFEQLELPVKNTLI